MRFLLSFFLPSSCTFEPPENAGKLVIRNNADSAVTFITGVWTHMEGSLEWVPRWQGSKPSGEAIALSLEPGTYDLKIRAEYMLISQFFETAYKQPAVVKTDQTLFYIFDGGGIYAGE
ncbi:MAG: hypothetical protein LBP74_07235, partial [Treponema sp.]|nr:hypothetical protein [Treponema sp.]